MHRFFWFFSRTASFILFLKVLSLIINKALFKYLKRKIAEKAETYFKKSKKKMHFQPKLFRCYLKKRRLRRGEKKVKKKVCNLKIQSIDINNLLVHLILELSGFCSYSWILKLRKSVLYSFFIQRLIILSFIYLN